MNQPLRGGGTTPQTSAPDLSEPDLSTDTVVEIDANTSEEVSKVRGYDSGVNVDTRAPHARHFTRLAELMTEAMDQGDEFSRVQAIAILQRMTVMLSDVDYDLN